MNGHMDLLNKLSVPSSVNIHAGHSQAEPEHVASAPFGLFRFSPLGRLREKQAAERDRVSSCFSGNLRWGHPFPETWRKTNSQTGCWKLI